MDVRQHIMSEVTAIRPFDPLETKHIADVLSWLRSDAPIFRIAKPDKPPKHLVSYFVVIDPAARRVLLGDHIKAGLWLPSGGHVEPDEHPRTTVIREAEEELSLHDVTFWQPEPLFVTVTQTVGLTAGHTDVSLWYVLLGDSSQPVAFDRGEFKAMQWFTYDDILTMPANTFDPHMQRFMRKFSSQA